MVHKVHPVSGEGDVRYVRMRSEDRSVWMKSSYYLDKYKLLIWIIIIFLIAVGFQFRTPAMIVNDLQHQIDANKLVVDRVVRPQVDTLSENLTVLLKLQCLDKKIPEDQLSLAGLNCPRLLGRQP